MGWLQIQNDENKFLIEATKIKELLKSKYNIDVDSDTLNHINDLIKEAVVNRTISNLNNVISDPIKFQKAKQKDLDKNQDFEDIVETLENFIIEQLEPIKEALNKLGRKRTRFFVGVLLFLACSIFLPILTNILTGIMELSVILLVFSITGILICGFLFIIYQLRIRKKKKEVQG